MPREKLDPPEAQKKLRGAGIIVRPGGYDFVTPVGMLGSLPSNSGVRKILCFVSDDTAGDFVAIILAMASPFPPKEIRLGPTNYAFDGLPLIIGKKFKAVLLTSFSRKSIPAVDSACNALPLGFEAPDYSYVRCSGRILQSPKSVELLLHAIQVVELPSVRYATMFEPVAGGYVFKDGVSNIQRKKHSVRLT